MAKDSKKRKKKPGTKTSCLVNIKRKEISAIVNYAYQRIKFIGDCDTAPRMAGGQKLWTHLKGSAHEIGMMAFLGELNESKEWGVGLCCVFKNKVNEELFDVIEATAVIEPVISEEVSAIISDVIKEMIEVVKASDSSLTDDRFIYYIYLFEPEFDPQLDVKVSELTDLLIQISDLDKRVPFTDGYPLIKSDIDTLPLGIKNNMALPKSKSQSYVEIQ